MIITVTNPYTIQSFFIILYDRDLEVVRTYQLPVSVAAPFANRLFRELMPGIDMSEPWYSLAPYTRDDSSLERAPLPQYPTSLYSEPFDPLSQDEPAIQLHPQAIVQYFVVRLFDINELKYEGAYSVDDIFLHGAHFLLHEGLLIDEPAAAIERAPFYYAVLPSKDPVQQVPANLLPDKMYETEGIFSLPVRARDEPRIAFRKLAAPPFPEKIAAQKQQGSFFGKGDSQNGQVIVPQDIYEAWRHRLQVSDINEEGGYIVGRVYRQPGSPEDEGSEDFRWIVEVSDIFVAEETIGTPVSLLFTHDTWSRGRIRRARDFSDLELVGWWHTHPFPATDTFGLSGWDQDKHARFFTRPYQIAILLNIEESDPRTVRCYQRGPDGLLVETPYLVTPASPSTAAAKDVDHDHPVSSP